MKLIRILALSVAIFAAVPAIAQTVMEIGPQGAVVDNAAKYVWATRDVTARRWADAETPTTGDVKTNDRLQLIYKTDTWVRVRIPKSPKFGWLPADAVVETQPAGAEAAPAGGGELSEDLQKAIQEKLREIQQQQGGAQ